MRIAQVKVKGKKAKEAWPWEWWADGGGIGRHCGASQVTAAMEEAYQGQWPPNKASKTASHFRKAVAAILLLFPETYCKPAIQR